MHIDWWTLALQTINLLVLAWLLGRFLFRPVARIVKERQDAVAQALDDARSTQEQAEAARREAKDAAAALAAEREQTLRSAGEEAAKERDRLVAAARAEADKIVEEARRDIERMRKSEEEENAKRAATLAVDIAARLFDRLPDEARISGFIGGIGSAISVLTETVRGEIGGDGAPVNVRAARALSGAETQACREALSKALGREVEITVAVDPELIAGIEIETPHTLVRNSFRADLDRIADELMQEGEGNG